MAEQKKANGKPESDNCKEEIFKKPRNWMGTYYKASRTFYVEVVCLNATQLWCREKQDEWHSYAYEKDNNFYSAIVLENLRSGNNVPLIKLYRVTCQKRNGKSKSTKYLTSSNIR